jgi:hypothetical protein
VRAGDAMTNAIVLVAQAAIRLHITNPLRTHA